MSRPNVLLITADHWRGDCLGAAGHTVIETPNIDRLAAEGTYFSRHYAQATPGSPARACLYTGLYQMTNRVVIDGTPLDQRHDNLARMARRGGYDPTLFGYTDQAIDPRTVEGDDPQLRTSNGNLAGFTERLVLSDGNLPWLSWLKSRGHDIPSNPLDIFLPSGGPSDKPSTKPALYSEDETPAAFVTGEFLRWLDERHGSDGWFAHVSLLHPHPPYVAAAPYNTKYDPDDGPEFAKADSWKQEAAQHPMLAHRLAHKELGPDFLAGAGKGLVADLTEADFRTIRATYWGMISEVDAQLGRLFDGLRKGGLWEDTIIILTSNHGEMMGDHFSLGSFGYFDQSTHVPLIVRDPRREGGFGKTVDAFTESVDIVPTLLDLCGLENQNHLDGQSLSPFLDADEPLEWRRAVHWEYDYRTLAGQLGRPIDQCSMAVMRDDRFKYVHFAHWQPLLFDLALDPDELDDRSEDPDYRDRRLDFAEALLSWRASHLDRRLTGLQLGPKGVIDLRKTG